jgi:type I restriction enzyme S subunit
LIALLKEKRQAVISHAVTKGLDPNAPMKSSGIEWIGEVPKHWETTKIKYSTRRIVDCPHETPKYDPEGKFDVIRTADINCGILDLTSTYKLDKLEYERRIRREPLLPEDILYSREGERWGHAAIVPDSPLMCLGQRMMQFRLWNSENPEFFMYALNSRSVYEQGAVDVVGATAPHINISAIRNFCMTRPPLLEQQAIADSVVKELSNIDKLVSKAVGLSTLLQERRTALISAAVTGKIDVRDFAPEAQKV